MISERFGMDDGSYTPFLEDLDHALVRKKRKGAAKTRNKGEKKGWPELATTQPAVAQPAFDESGGEAASLLVKKKWSGKHGF